MTAQKSGGKITLPPVSEIGVLVKDVDKVAEFYATVLGLGPFEINEQQPDGALYRGSAAPFKVRYAKAQVGQQVQIRFIQPLLGETIQTDLLRKRGEGLSHLYFYVDNFDEKLAELEKHGIKPVFSRLDKAPGKMRFAYLDTDKIGGVIIVLFEKAGNGKG